MKLKKWNYDLGESGGFEQVEHPNHIIKTFMEFVLFNQQWPEQLEIMYNRFLKLKRDLTDARNEAAAPKKDWDAVSDGYCHAETKSGDPCRNTILHVQLVQAPLVVPDLVRGHDVDLPAK